MGRQLNQSSKFSNNSTTKRPFLKKTLSMVIEVPTEEFSTAISKQKNNFLPRIDENNINRVNHQVDDEEDEEAFLTVDVLADRENYVKEGQKWNILTPYLDREKERRNDVIKYFNLDELMQMEATKERELHKLYKNSSFYNLHMLLRYQADQITTSYRRPCSRLGYSVNRRGKQQFTVTTIASFWQKLQPMQQKLPPMQQKLPPMQRETETSFPI